MQTDNLPSWNGASHCYSKAYRILNAMAKSGHATPATHTRRGKVMMPGSVSEEMSDFIDALNQGDEEMIKALNYKYREYD